MAKVHTEVEMSQLPKCSFCDQEARYDGRTQLGPWAYMCDWHYALHGVGLGLGKGQRLVLQAKELISKP